MKKIVIAVLMIASYFTTAAQDTTKASSKLISATVYYGYGAELTHETKASVNNSTKQIVISQLSTSIDENSLQIKVPESITLLSQKFKVIYPQAEVVKDPLTTTLQDSITLLNIQLRRNANLISIEEQTLAKTGVLIEAAVSNEGNKATSSDEILKLVNAYTIKIEKAKTNIFNYKEIETALNAKVQSLQERINTANDNTLPSSKPYGQLTLQVICNEAQTVPISFSYFTNTAGWTPLYDVRVNSKTNEIKLVYKASLTQSTGIDWKHTNLTLSTANPSMSNTMPVLNAWYLQWYVPLLYKDLSNSLQRKIGNQATMNTSFIGFANSTSNSLNYLAPQTTNDTVTPSTLQEFTTLKESQLNTNFEIALPYDIESDGEIHAVTIKEEKINAGLKNYAIPKLDNSAYLLADITDWENLDLLPGTANIIIDDTYLGKSVIDPNSIADTLSLSLGKDKRIAIKRNIVKEFTTVKTKGNTTSQTVTYEITVKNNKLTPVNVALKDQYPISTTSEVEVTLNDSDNAEVIPETGILNWKLQLKPGESQKVKFSYTVKYPKDKKLANL
ncbi:DUF4139 domain-containing protein [Ferruginibacter albus]|uniref:DUF4139 domain-containing protein n=1 Tax=Ferruginibacter albus TaxID=2875540 RepID=UPI001CC6B3C3|nr:DUF4139 domain-containing protein [Ferruginibacter albus]UAY52181.1 DUF4139 domain-containing protein [Ferruginibacter albus]